MKAEMNEHGTITLSPETSVEVYALSQWAKQAYVEFALQNRAESHMYRGSMLLVKTSIEGTES